MENNLIIRLYIFRLCKTKKTIVRKILNMYILENIKNMVKQKY